MPSYRSRMAAMTTYPWSLLGADFCDELDEKITKLSVRIANAEEKINLLDTKVAACCDGRLAEEVKALKAEVAALKEAAALKPAVG